MRRPPTRTTECFVTFSCFILCHPLGTTLDPPSGTLLSQVPSRVSHSMIAERFLDKEMKPKAWSGDSQTPWYILCVDNPPEELCYLRALSRRVCTIWRRSNRSWPFENFLCLAPRVVIAHRRETTVCKSMLQGNDTKQGKNGGEMANWAHVGRNNTNKAANSFVDCYTNSFVDCYTRAKSRSTVRPQSDGSNRLIRTINTHFLKCCVQISSYRHGTYNLLEMFAPP